MKFIISLFTSGLVALLGCVAMAGEKSPIQIEAAWVRAVPPSSTVTAAFMKFINTSDKPFRLTSASCPIAEMVSPMITTKRKVSGQEVTGMQDVDALDVPAHGERVLAPGGDHLMLMNLKGHLKPGDKVKLIFHFEPGGKEIVLEVPVKMN